MVNPGISRDGKYSKNLENWEKLGIKILNFVVHVFL